MCKYYAYIRVSTSEAQAKQTYERQQFILASSGIDFEEIFEEHISGGVKGNQREQFNKMLERLEQNDVVCFTETSRFGRNYIDCFEMLDLITQSKKATVKFISQGIVLEGGAKMNPYQWMMISQFFIQDEFLKRQIGYNTANALQAKKAQGVTLGRPTAFSMDEALKLKKQGLSQKEIAATLGVTPSAVCVAFKKHNQSKE